MGRKGSRSDSSYPNNNRGSKFESNSREGPRYKPDNRKNSGYENPTSSRKNKRGNKEDTDSDTEDNLATPKRKRSKPLKYDSEKMRPTHNYLKTPKEGKQNQRDESQSLQDPKYQELLQYLRKQQQQTSSESSSDSSSESSSESSSGTSSDDEKVEDRRSARH